MRHALRQNGYVGSVAIVGREHGLPYVRPPQFWEEKQITLLLGREVVKVDPATKYVVLSDGTAMAYGTLAWATGGDPHRLSCVDLDDVHAIRTRADCDQLGIRITLLEAAPRVLARVTGLDLSAFYEADHRAHGVDLRTGVSVERLLSISGGRVTGMVFQDDAVFAVDAVIVGIGIVPAVAPLIATSAEGGACDGRFLLNVAARCLCNRGLCKLRLRLCRWCRDARGIGVERQR